MIEALIILCTSLCSKSNGEFAANNILQDIPTVLVKLTLLARIQWRWLLSEKNTALGIVCAKQNSPFQNEEIYIRRA